MTQQLHSQRNKGKFTSTQRPEHERSENNQTGKNQNIIQ